MHLLSSRKLTLFLFPKIESFDSLETWEFVKFPSCHGCSIREEKEISSWTWHGWIVDGYWSGKKEEKREKKKKKEEEGFSLDTASISSDTIFQGLLGLQCNSRKKSRAKEGRRRRETGSARQRDD